jgi:RNase H-fold protein (predicted Holliday junction resolvase)
MYRIWAKRPGKPEALIDNRLTTKEAAEEAAQAYQEAESGVVDMRIEKVGKD